jgi:hypothetical protein
VWGISKAITLLLLLAINNFTPFMVSTDGLLGKEAQTLLKKISALLAKKWEKLYSEVCGYVNARMCIMLLPLFEPQPPHLCLHAAPMS